MAGRPDGDDERSRWMAVAIAALAVEAALLAGVVTLLRRPAAPPAALPPMQIVLEAPRPVPKPAHIAPPRPKAPPRPIVARPKTPVAVEKPRMPPRPRPRVTPPPPVLLPAAQQPPPVTPPPTPPSPTPPPLPQVALPPPVPEARPSMPVAPPPASVPIRPAVDLGALRAAYGQAVHAAIQSAVRYPEMARRMGESGRTLVAFRFEQGTAHDVRIVTSSGSGALDRAAVRAVHDASFPQPPAALQGKPLQLQLWIEFRLAGGAN